MTHGGKNEVTIQPTINLLSCVQNGFSVTWDSHQQVPQNWQSRSTVKNLHTNLRDLLEGNVEVEVIQQVLAEEGSTSLTNNEDSDDDDVVEDSQGF